MKLSRDSVVLWLGILAGLVMFLAGQKPIWEWGYYDWLAAAGFLVATLSGKLATSPLPGGNDPKRADERTRGPALPLVLLALMASGLTACGGKTPAVIVPATTLDARAEIAARVEQAGLITAQAQQVEIALYKAGVVSREAHITVQESLLGLSVAVQAAVATLATTNQTQDLSTLLATVEAEVQKADDRLQTIDGPAKTVLRALMTAIRAVLRFQSLLPPAGAAAAPQAALTPLLAPADAA